MRLAVLDIGSNTVHLLIAELRPGGRPIATSSNRVAVRLMRFLQPDGSISDEGVQALLSAVREAATILKHESVDDFLTTATSAVREATNGPTVIAQIEQALGSDVQVLAGASEAQLTFLAARRWFGWSAGTLLMLDIGGGSLEIAYGSEEVPTVALSVPLGAGRMTLEYLRTDPPEEDAITALREHARQVLAPAAIDIGSREKPDLVVGSSKTIRSLAKLAGTSFVDAQGTERVTLTADALGAWIPRLAKLPTDARTVLPGVTVDRAAQIVGGAVVLHETMRALSIPQLQTSPWALREGVLLRYAESRLWES